MRNTNPTRAPRSRSHEYFVALLGALALVLLAPRSLAGPLVFEQKARITSPDPSYIFGDLIAIGGNSIIVSGHRAGIPGQDIAVFLFERNASGTWTFVRRLVDVNVTNGGLFDIAMNSLVAAVALNELLVFERTAAGWVSAPTAVEAGRGRLEVHSGRILVGQVAASCYDARLIEKRAGIWTTTRDFLSPPAPFFDCSSPNDIDLTGNRVIIGHPSNEEEPLPTQVHIWDRNSDGSWPVSPSATVPVGPADGEFLTIEGDDAIVGSRSGVNGPYILKRTGSWSVVGRLQRPDGAAAGPLYFLDLLNGILVGADAGGIAIFQRNAGGTFDYVAKGVVNDELVDNQVILGVEISGRRLIATGVTPNRTIGVVYVFDLPADFSQPALIQDDFEDRNAAEWTPIPGSVVSVPFNGLSSFYRQSSVTGGAGGLRTGVDMVNQSIEADVVGRNFATGTGERWFGLTVRQMDPDNQYYLTLRNTNVISLRKLVNGVITVLASAEMPVQLNRRHKLRLEAVGSRIAAYVDGQLRLSAIDRSLKRGTPGLRMFRTAADYDNVVISPNPQTTLLEDDFERTFNHEQWWFPRLGTWSEVTDDNAAINRVVFAQTSISGDGRITAGIDAEDQVIQARARATQFAAGDRWFGLVSRLQDNNNFYYLTVRSSNSVSLRRFMNGQVAVLDSAEFPVTLGTWYTLRLEAIGNSLRGYVNGRPLVEAVDSSFAEGTYGLATSRAAAQFDNVRVTQP